VVGAGPQLGDDARRLLQDSVTRGAGTGVPENVVPGDVARAPEFSGDACLGVSGLYLLGSPSFSPPPIN
jgi:hypothetical protein